MTKNQSKALKGLSQAFKKCWNGWRYLCLEIDEEEKAGPACTGSGKKFNQEIQPDDEKPALTWPDGEEFDYTP